MICNIFTPHLFKLSTIPLEQGLRVDGERLLDWVGKVKGQRARQLDGLGVSRIVRVVALLRGFLIAGGGGLVGFHGITHGFDSLLDVCSISRKVEVGLAVLQLSEQGERVVEARYRRPVRFHRRLRILCARCFSSRRGGIARESVGP